MPAKVFRIESIDPGGECDVEFSCRKCGTKSRLKVGFWFGREMRCPSCGLTNFIDPFQKALHREEAFSAALPDNMPVALWGAGGIYYKLMQKYGLLASEKFLLVDANPSQQGLTICGKEIHHPDIIFQKNIKTVVISALSRKDDIRAALRSKYPSVEHVLIPAHEVTDEGIIPVLKAM